MNHFLSHGVWDAFRTYNFFCACAALTCVVIDTKRWWQLDRRRRLIGVAMALFCIAMIEGTIESRLLAAAPGPRNAFFATAITFVLIAAVDGIRYTRTLKRTNRVHQPDVVRHESQSGP